MVAYAKRMMVGVALAALMAGQAWAGDDGPRTGGVKVGGDIEQNTTVIGNVHRNSTGIASSAKTRNGTVTDREAGGQLAQGSEGRRVGQGCGWGAGSGVGAGES